MEKEIIEEKKKEEKETEEKKEEKETEEEEEIAEATYDGGIKWSSYQSIENHYREKHIGEIVTYGFNNKLVWCATEKVHGANFSFIYDSKIVRCANRSTILQSNSKFSNFQSLIPIYEPIVKKTFDLLKAKYTELAEIVVYGEFFGGMYPHKSVPKVPGVAHIQKGIYYTPKLDFYAFDIRIYTLKDEELIGKLLDYDEVLDIFKAAGYPLYAEPLASGTFDEMLNYPSSFISTLPTKYGLPPIDDNYAEGVVLKPFKTSYFPRGGRVIVKNKRPEFGEISHGKGKLIHEHKVKTTPDNTDIADLIIDCQRYVTPQRLTNVLSKIENPNSDQMAKITGLLAADATDEFRKDNKVIYDTLTPQKRKPITGAINKAAGQLVKANWQAILDRTF